MSFTAKYRLGSLQQPLSDVARTVPDLTIQLEGTEQLHPDRCCSLFVSQVHRSTDWTLGSKNLLSRKTLPHQ